MANSYTIAPGNVVGDLTIGRNLIIHGTAGRFMHLANDATQTVAMGFNYDTQAGALDDVTTPGAYLEFNPARQIWVIGNKPVAGSLRFMGLPIVLMLAGGSAANTGNTTENQIFSTPLNAGYMQQWGQIRLFIYLNVTVQGAGTTTLRVKLGATVVASIGITAAQDAIIEVAITNQGATNSQKTTREVRVNGVAPACGITSTAVDTTVGTTLSITIQNANATDSSNIPVVQGQLVGTDAFF